MNLANSLAFAKARGAAHIALAAYDLSDVPLTVAVNTGILLFQPEGQADRAGVLHRQGWTVMPFAEAPKVIDAVVVLDKTNIRPVMRAANPLSRRGVLVVPSHADSVVDPALRASDASQAAPPSRVDANYVARCGLRGHYVEFGTWYGQSFFENYYRYRHWLRGRFYAFDSFAGLSQPEPAETAFTGGDLSAGAYCCNAKTFEAIADLVEVPRERLRIVPGFFKETLRKSPAEYGLSEGSVSVCAIDCALRAPAEDALAFVTPLLEPGALLYFGGWRTARGSAQVGERAAAVAWLNAHREFELIELYRDRWEHQWFIFQRQ